MRARQGHPSRSSWAVAAGAAYLAELAGALPVPAEGCAAEHKERVPVAGMRPAAENRHTAVLQVVKTTGTDFAPAHTS